eukprot:5822523-Amphidinium_carterae.1
MHLPDGGFCRQEEVGVGQSFSCYAVLAQEGMEIATLAACTVCGAYIARRSCWARRPCPGPEQALSGLANQRR